MKRMLKALRRRVKSVVQSRAERRHALVGPAQLWELKRSFQVTFLKAAGLLPEHTLLDLGCGTLRGGIPLIDYLQSGHYVGIESRQNVLDEGRKELAEAGLEHKQPLLIASPDASTLDLEQRFDFIWAFSVLIHMSNDVLARSLGFVARHLARDGVFYANVNIGTRPEGNWRGFPVVWRTLEFYHAACGTHGLVVADLGTLKAMGHVTNIESQDRQRMLRITRQ